MVRSKKPSPVPWLKMVKERYVENKFQENEPIIYDEEDVWIHELYASREDTSNHVERYE